MNPLFTPRVIIPFIFTVGIIYLSQFVIPFDKIKIFISFMILIPIHLTYTSYRMPFVFAIALLFLSAAAMVFNNLILAQQVATYSFWLLIVGFILLAVKYFRFENHKNKAEANEPQNMRRNMA